MFGTDLANVNGPCGGEVVDLIEGLEGRQKPGLRRADGDVTVFGPSVLVGLTSAVRDLAAIRCGCGPKKLPKLLSAKVIAHRCADWQNLMNLQIFLVLQKKE